MLDRQIRFDGKESGERVALLLGKLAAKAVFLEDGIALLRRHLAEVAEGAGDKAATVLWKATKLPQGTHNLLALRWRQMLHRFGAFNDAAALFGRHIVELRKAVEHALLCLLREITEAGFVLQGTLLVCQRKIAVTIHPLCQMLLIPLRTRTRNGAWTRLTYAKTHSRSALMYRLRLSDTHRRRCAQYQGSESWLESPAELYREWHDIQLVEDPEVREKPL
jgi:hypothetical protein